MKIIGFTGGSGCGKTTALQALAPYHALILDCDAVYHELLRTDRELTASIGARFPGTVRDGVLDRKALGNVVFSDPEALEALSAITDPVVMRRVQVLLDEARTAGRRVAALDAIRLEESGLADLCDVTIAVTAPLPQRIRRLMAREGISEDYARARIAAQRSNESFSQSCDFTLENSGDLSGFHTRCSELLQTILKEESNMSENIYKEQREQLLYQPKNAYLDLSDEDFQAMNAYCSDYMQFLTKGKTERECVTEAVRQAEEAGFQAYKPGMALQPGDRIYTINRGKSAIFAVIGKEDLSHGAQIAAAHIDSPRMDLKPNPLYEDAELALFKTHYYGGIKKYQWTVTPLAIHGVVSLKNGETVTVCIGEDPKDPVFCVTDLLIHLSGEQMKKTLAEGVSGEALNLLIGSQPLKDDDGADAVKFHVLKLLNEKYGIVEQDFYSAELCIVPAGPTREVGLDRSMIGGYGHDDRVCSYAEFWPMLRLGTPNKTCVCVLADKEEIGSVGVSGMQSVFFETFMKDLCETQGVALRRCFEASKCLSADVTNALDPTYDYVSDRRNNTRLNYGVGLCKYTGSRGKSGASDASAELVGYVTRLLDQHGIRWQMGELGKVDAGGGGTVAAYMANRNIDTLDAGVPVLSMHAPFEVVAKLDCYMTMRAMQVFYED